MIKKKLKYKIFQNILLLFKIIYLILNFNQ